MKSVRRVGLSAFVVIGSVAIVLGLSSVGSASEGPLTSLLQWIGGHVAHFERSAVSWARGPGRAQRLSWLAPLRTDADLLRAPQRLLLGAYEPGVGRSLEGVLAMEDALGTTLPLVQIYTAWGDEPEQRFPSRFVEAVDHIGSIPVITWEPWLTDFENRLHPHLPLRSDREEGGLADIAAGMYDFYVDDWAAAAAAHGKPVFVRFGHEMNDPYRYPWGPQNGHPDDFVLAWRHVVERFRDAGADNVLWVWAPHVAYEGYEWYYPGDEYVDWVGTGALNYGTVARWSDWWSFKEIFGDRYDTLAALGKPIMIAELGSLAVGGDRTEWYAAALRDLPERYPLVKAAILFHVPSDATVTYQALDWSFIGDSALVRAMAAEIAAWPEEDEPTAR